MPTRIEIASVESIGDLWQRSCSTACSQVDNARQGVRPIENAIRPAQELNLVDSRIGNIGELDQASNIVHRNSIQQNFICVVVAAAHEERRNSTSLASLKNLGPWRL